MKKTSSVYSPYDYLNEGVNEAVFQFKEGDRLKYKKTGEIYVVQKVYPQYLALQKEADASGTSGVFWSGPSQRLRPGMESLFIKVNESVSEATDKYNNRYYDSFKLKYGLALTKKMDALKQREYPASLHAKFQALRDQAHKEGKAYYEGDEIDKLADAYDAKLIGVPLAKFQKMKEDWKDVEAAIGYDYRFPGRENWTGD